MISGYGWLAVAAFVFTLVASLATGSKGYYRHDGMGWGCALVVVFGGFGLLALIALTHGMALLIPLALILPGKVLYDYIQEKRNPPKP